MPWCVGLGTIEHIVKHGHGAGSLAVRYNDKVAASGKENVSVSLFVGRDSICGLNGRKVCESIQQGDIDAIQAQPSFFVHPYES